TLFRSRPRVTSQGPELGVELSPQLVRTTVPRPAQIQRELGERLEPDVLRLAHDGGPPSCSRSDAVLDIVVTRPSSHTRTVCAIRTKSPVPTTPGIDFRAPSSRVASVIGPTA